MTVGLGWIIYVRAGACQRVCDADSRCRWPWVGVPPSRPGPYRGLPPAAPGGSLPSWCRRPSPSPAAPYPQCLRWRAMPLAGGRAREVWKWKGFGKREQEEHWVRERWEEERIKEACYIKIQLEIKRIAASSTVMWEDSISSPPTPVKSSGIL